MTEEPDNWRTLGEVLGGMLRRGELGQRTRDDPRSLASIATGSAASVMDGQIRPEPAE